MAAVVIAALVCTGGYTVLKIMEGYKTSQAALVEFGHNVQAIAGVNGWRYRAISGGDEGMLLYLQQPTFIKKSEALQAWNQNKLDALVISAEDLDIMKDGLAPYKVVTQSEPAPEKNNRYFLVVRNQSINEADSDPSKTSGR